VYVYERLCGVVEHELGGIDGLFLINERRWHGCKLFWAGWAIVYISSASAMRYFTNIIRSRVYICPNK